MPSRGLVMVTPLDCDISHIHFRTNILGKGMKYLIP